ncbi:MAG: homoserine dehydrogenase [Alphaproteobacteria bacterium]|nr:homoserine dehydrogenase [Alphaproteobacteria bacterium]MBU0859742.1 homoserine dehydrogenase [Alphaproteobacteria bacterium]
MSDVFRIGIAGLGTVGAGVVRLLQTHEELITQRAGKRIEIVAVSARDKNRKRDVDLDAYDWIDDPVDMADVKGLDAVVELMGGTEGAARTLVERTLMNKRAVVTANKALLAVYGTELAGLSENHHAPLMFEAAVAGGIPAIKGLREGFAANTISAVYGILNGTCNYILTTMRETGRHFDDVLVEAQAKGYAEADPAFDIDGIDASHKLCILSALAFGVKPSLADIATTGIRKVTADDIKYANELGYRIKLLGIARRVDGGRIAQTVEPCMVPLHSPMGAVDGVYNAVFVEGDFVGTGLSVGRGAGAGPTASAVVADLIDLARGHGNVPVFGMQVNDLADGDWAGPEAVHCGYYMHLVVRDEPGVLAAVSAIMRDHDISIEVVLQRGRDPGKPVAIVMVSHPAPRAQVNTAISLIAALESVIEDPHIIRIEEF